MAYYPPRSRGVPSPEDAFNGFTANTTVAQDASTQPAFGGLMSYISNQGGGAPNAPATASSNRQKEAGAATSKVLKSQVAGPTTLQMADETVKPTVAAPEPVAISRQERAEAAKASSAGRQRSFDAAGRVMAPIARQQSAPTADPTNVAGYALNGLAGSTVKNSNPLTNIVPSLAMTAGQQANYNQYNEYLRPHGVSEDLWREAIQYNQGKRLSNEDIAYLRKRASMIEGKQKALMEMFEEMNSAYQDRVGGTEGQRAKLAARMENSAKTTTAGIIDKEKPQLALANRNWKLQPTKIYSDENLKENVNTMDGDELSRIINDLTNGAR